MVKNGKLGVIKEIKMFLGGFEYRIAEKGRAPIPSQFRRELKEGVVSTPGVERCITAYPLSEWKKLAICNFLVRMRCNGFRSEQTVRQQR